MKTITDHYDGFGLNDLIEIRPGDEDVNGVPHRFVFDRRSTKVEALPVELTPGYDSWTARVGEIQFQKGPRNVEGSTPGLTTDAVLVALLHHLNGFQNGPFKSRETALVITKLEEALHWSQARAKDRARRGVLGQNKA